VSCISSGILVAGGLRSCGLGGMVCLAPSIISAAFGEWVWCHEQHMGVHNTRILATESVQKLSCTECVQQGWLYCTESWRV